jgi:hypothetical protein
VKSDDGSLAPEQFATVHRTAISLLDRGGAWGRFPTPVDDLMSAANLHVAPISAFDQGSIKRYIREVGAKAERLLLRALDKVLGIFDVHADVVHIDPDVSEGKQTFLKLHEAGHKELPHQRGLYRWIQDGERFLSPETVELFEREANTFARLVLFQDDAFSRHTVDEPFAIKVPMDAAKKFGASLYAGFREYVRRHNRTCAAVVLNPTRFSPALGLAAEVRRVEPSPSFRQLFGSGCIPKQINHNHGLMACIPISPRRMSKPQSFGLVDRNGQLHEFVGEGFRTP